MKITEAARDSMQRDLASEQQTLADALDVIRKNWFTIAAFLAFAVAMALIYVVTTPPSFTAETQLLIERRVSRDNNANVNPALEQGLFESQMTLMASEGLLLKVIEDKNLLDDPDLTGSLPAGAASDQTRRKIAALDAFQRRLNVRRLGASYGVAISYRASDPKTAARVANAVAQAYLQDQIDTNSKLLAQDTRWLEDRLEELRKKVADATVRLKEFRPAQYNQPPGQGADQQSSHPTLDELESRATALRRIYEGYIQSYYANLNQQAIPQLTARVVSPALPPVRKSHPQSTMVLGISALLGSIFGLGMVALREALSPPVRHEGQIRRIAEPLGRLPWRRSSLVKQITSPLSWLRREDQGSRHLLRYNTALRQLRNAVPIGGADGTVLAVTSPKSGEGRTTLVYGLAGTFATDGLTTVIIDACIEDARITKDAQAATHDGLTDILLGNADIKSCVLPHPFHRADVIPIGLSTRQLGTLTSPKAGEAWNDLIAKLKNSYDRVLIDLSVPSADRLAAGAGLENVIVVAEYGRTPIDAIAHTVSYFEARSLPVAGVLINKTPARS